MAKHLEALQAHRAGSLSQKEIDSYTDRMRRILKYYKENPLRISLNTGYLEQVLDDYEIMLDEAKKTGIRTPGSDTETWRTYRNLNNLVTEATQGET